MQTLTSLSDKTQFISFPNQSSKEINSKMLMFAMIRDSNHLLVQAGFVNEGVISSLSIIDTTPTTTYITASYSNGVTTLTNTSYMNCHLYISYE